MKGKSNTNKTANQNKTSNQLKEQNAKQTKKKKYTNFEKEIFSEMNQIDWFPIDPYQD